MQYYLAKENLLSFLHKSEVSRLDKLLLLLFYDGEQPKNISKLMEIAETNGLREAKKWNASDILTKSKGKAVGFKDGWTITLLGKQHLFDSHLISEKRTITKNDVADLRLHLQSVQNTDSVNFIEEAIICLEADQKRAAVVFSWVGAVSILHDFVIKNHLSDFNKEAVRRDSKWKLAKTSDDLSKMKEHDFLDILEFLSVIGKNVKQELQNCLQLRNACGHPNSLKIGLRRVSAHMEILILNVFSKF